jgi:hypothetical protein
VESRYENGQLDAAPIQCEKNTNENCLRLMLKIYYMKIYINESRQLTGDSPSVRRNLQVILRVLKMVKIS